MDNAQVAQVLGEIADLLEIKGENAFTIRAYRTGADTIKAWSDPVALMDDIQLRAPPGIGNGRFGDLTLLAGIECDILPDGRLDLPDDCVAQLDIVVASVHSHFSQDESQMTERILRALDNPWVDVLGHPTSRRLLRREPLRIQMEALMAAAAGTLRWGLQVARRAWTQPADVLHTRPLEELRPLLRRHRRAA